MDNSFILDGIKWSYSSVSAYNQCPRMFKNIYIDSYSKSDNAFAQWGSLIHSILERYYSGQLDFFDLLDTYRKEYSKSVTYNFPPNAFVDLSKSYYASGEEFFRQFEDEFSDYTVIAIEKEIKSKLNGKVFVGFIDLILQDKTTGKYVIVDHKSHKFRTKKEITSYFKQLYLYGTHIKETYGVYPDKLIFNAFRSNQLVETIWEDKKYEETVKWFTESIDSIYTDENFDMKQNQFFCDYLCSVRHTCPCSSGYLGEPPC